MEPASILVLVVDKCDAVKVQRDLFDLWLRFVSQTSPLAHFCFARIIFSYFQFPKSVGKSLIHFVSIIYFGERLFFPSSQPSFAFEEHIFRKLHLLLHANLIIVSRNYFR